MKRYFCNDPFYCMRIKQFNYSSNYSESIMAVVLKLTCKDIWVWLFVSLCFKGIEYQTISAVSTTNAQTIPVTYMLDVNYVINTWLLRYNRLGMYSDIQLLTTMIFVSQALKIGKSNIYWLLWTICLALIPRCVEFVRLCTAPNL